MYFLDNHGADPVGADTVSALAVSPHEADHAWLRAAFDRSGWWTYQARSFEEAAEVLRNHAVALVLCESVLPDGDWRRLLRRISTLPSPPLLIIAAQEPSPGLWAEALNLGAYDVLAKPFDSTEFSRVMSLAWLHWKDSVAARSLR